MVLFLWSCSNVGKPESHPDFASIRTQIGNKAELYEQLIPDVSGPDGFLATKHCDSVLFSGLYGAGNSNVNLLAARAPDGTWRRRTLALPDCYFSTQEERDAAGVGGSRSSISRDMFVGIIWWLWRHGDREGLRQILDYAIANDYVMGQGDPFRTGLGTTLSSIIAEAIYSLSSGNINYLKHRLFPRTYASGLKSYEAHLQVWLIVLEAEITGRVTNTMYNRLREHVLRQPNNPLYQAAWAVYGTGSLELTGNILLDEDKYPSDKLPTHCSSWPINNDNPEVWKPCAPGSDTESTGAELVAIYRLVLCSR